MNPIEPCPFCGHDDIKIKKEMKNFIFKDGTPMRGMWYEAECEYCGCYLGPAPSMEMLVENWNSRAEPKRKKGKWTGDCCSCCGVSKYNYIKMVDDECEPFGTWNFCPHCGADMRGD